MVRNFGAAALLMIVGCGSPAAPGPDSSRLEPGQGTTVSLDQPEVDLWIGGGKSRRLPAGTRVVAVADDNGSVEDKERYVKVKFEDPKARATGKARRKATHTTGSVRRRELRPD
jgi:hypothetical protein